MGDITDSHKSIADNLTSIHGTYRLANERSGVILYMACPHCLSEKGKSEFDSRHMAIMLDVWLKSTYNVTVAKCMRCNKKFKKNELLNWPSLKDRNFCDNNRNQVSFKIPKPVSFKEVIDGVSVPYGPGRVVPITELPKSHPAWCYLLSRDTLDIETLVRDFHPQFCVCEAPENAELGIFYKKLPIARNTPQGRIVFNSFTDGHLSAWQSRLIEASIHVNGGKINSFLHPDTLEFINTSFVIDGNVTFIGAYTKKNQTPVKYYNGRFHKHKIIFGHDAYLKRVEHIPYSDRVIYVAEGILDAVQLDGFGVACLGKQLCPDQVAILLSLSPKIVFLVQNDTAAELGFEANKELFNKLNLEIFRISPPKEFNDFGEMHYKHVQSYVLTTSGTY